MLEMTIENVFVSLKISSYTRITTGIQLFEMTYKDDRIVLFGFKGFLERNPWSQYLKGTTMQIKITLIKDCLRIPEYPENFAFQLFVILQ